MHAELRKGGPGQFDVLAGGEVVASRSTGLLARVLGGGWPDEREVVEALRRRLAG